MGDTAADFEIAGKDSAEIGEELSHEIWLKGYCVLEMGLMEKVDGALDDVNDLKTAGRFTLPPMKIIDGIMGPEGSAEWATLRSEEDTSDEKETDGESLKSLSQEHLNHMAEVCTQPFFDSMGMSDRIRHTDSYVVRGGEQEVGEEPTELTEDTCSLWLSTFLHAKLCMIYFLGPGEGDLELEPYDDDAEVKKIKTKPDMLVIFRCDKMKHTHMSTGNDYAIVSWLVAPPTRGPRGWKGGDPEMVTKMPHVREMVDWVDQHLQDLAILNQTQKGLPEETGREWGRAMRTTYLGQNNIPCAVKGVATHSPSTQDSEQLWKCISNGADLVGNVPFKRWDHVEYYDPDPVCYMKSSCFCGQYSGGATYTSVNHFSAIDGVDLFDAKFFQISASEATGMEPQQRHILETSYEALYEAGYVKKTLMGNYIAVFSGCTHPEATYIAYTTGAGAGNVSQAITSNRTSFVLGIMGPSTSIDAEQASSAMALQVGCAAVCPNHNHRDMSGGFSESAIVGGVYLCLTPYIWPRRNAYMNPAGRSFTFDSSAGGYVFGESCTSMALKTYLEKVDNEFVVPETTRGATLATIVGYRNTNNGRAASLSTPHGPAIQENIMDAINLAKINILDLDAVECHGSGGVMDDALEVASTQKVLRPDGAEDCSLILGAVKSNLATHDSATGMDSYMKVIFNTLYAVNAPNLHLKQVNPHLDYGSVSDAGIFINTEHVAYKERDVFHSWSSRGFGGSNTHIVSWWMVDSNKVEQNPCGLERQAFAFWPGGGGILDRDATPDEAYYIVGSWNEWKKADEMEKDGDTYTFTVTMGPNKFETFQIWLDGDGDRILHPMASQASSGTKVEGPNVMDDVLALNWLIDARSTTVMAAAAPAAGDTALVSTEEVIEVSSRDRGSPGDQYKVKLVVTGKYRAVSWKKCASATEEDVKAAYASGTYYFTGTTNGWGMTPMESGPAGTFTVQVSLGTRKNCEFYIVRNMDFDQTFSPSFPGAGMDSDAVLETGGGNNYWNISGSMGDKFQVTFTRTIDTMKVSWSPC
jgi:polyketide synthase-associated protein